MKNAGRLALVPHAAAPPLSLSVFTARSHPQLQQQQQHDDDDKLLSLRFLGSVLCCGCG